MLTSDWAPSNKSLLRFFDSRRDGQIMGLELLSIAYGVLKILFASPATSVMKSVSRLCRHVSLRGVDQRSQCNSPFGQHGCAACDPEGHSQVMHTCIVHSIWYEDCLAAFPMMLLLCARACRLRALELEMGLWISRVPSEDNIADDPSREEYEVLRALKAVRIEPRMHPKFLEFKAWDVISLRSESPMASIPVEDEVVCDLLF